MPETIPADLLVPAILKRLEADGSPAPGLHALKGRVTLAVDVTINKGEATTYRPTSHLPWKSILAVALQRAGVKREKLVGLIVDAARAALKKGAEVPDLDVTEEALQRVEQEVIDHLPHQHRQGATRVDGTVAIVGWKPAKSVGLRAASTHPDAA